MKRTFVYLLISAFFLSYCGKPNPNRQKIKSCYGAYKSAILEGKGEEAVKYLSEKTIAYYDKMLDIVRTGTSEKIEKLPLTDKLMVISTRHRATPEEIKQFTGKSLIVWSVDNGMISKESVEQAALGFITLKEKTAKGNFKLNNKTTPYYYHFFVENGEWKLDLGPILKSAEEAMQKVKEQLKMPEDELIVYLVEAASNKKIEGDIWNKTFE